MNTCSFFMFIAIFKYNSLTIVIFFPCQASPALLPVLKKMPQPAAKNPAKELKSPRSGPMGSEINISPTIIV